MFEHLGDLTNAYTQTLGMNQVTLLGRVGQDPTEMGTDKHPVVVFGLATNTNIKGQGKTNKWYSLIRQRRLTSDEFIKK